MGSMPSSPHVAATAVVLAATALAVDLALSPAPLAPSSAAVVAIGVVIYSIITVVGLVLVRGNWARRLGIVVALTVIAVAAVADDYGAWSLLATAAGLVALGSLAGRWLDGWIRGRPSATGPDPQAVVLLLGLLGLVPLVGLASPGGLEAAHGVLGAAGVLLTWGYGKAQLWALWAARLVLPVIVAAAAVVSPWLGAAALAAYGIGLGWLAWSREVRLAVQPMMDELPGPRPIRQRRDTTPS